MKSNSGMTKNSTNLIALTKKLVKPDRACEDEGKTLIGSRESVDVIATVLAHLPNASI